MTSTLPYFPHVLLEVYKPIFLPKVEAESWTPLFVDVKAYLCFVNCVEVRQLLDVQLGAIMIRYRLTLGGVLVPACLWAMSSMLAIPEARYEACV